MRLLKTLLLLILVTSLSGCGLFKEEEIDENATVEELYAMARQSLDNGNWVKAVEQLQLLEARYPYGVHAQQAQLDTIYAHYRNDDTAMAISAADRFIRLHPTHESVDYAYFLKGQANFEEDDSNFGLLLGKNDLSDRDPSLTLNALKAFEDVYTLFPDSRYAPVARERARHLTDTLARYELSTARFYFAREAYVAAANRAKGIVEEYSDTPSVEEALGLLIASYTAMGLADLADDSRRVLALNFPNSRFLDENVEFEGARYTDAGKRTQKEDSGFMSGLRRIKDIFTPGPSE